MKKITLFFIMALIFTSSFAQYPFESKPGIHYMRYSHWKILDTTDKRSAFLINVPKFFYHNIDLKVLVASYPGGADSSVITLFKGNEQFLSFVDPYFIGSVVGPAPQAVFIEDVNGNGLKDIKILIDGNACCGAYNYYQRLCTYFKNQTARLLKLHLLTFQWNIKTDSKEILMAMATMSSLFKASRAMATTITFFLISTTTKTANW